MSVLRDELTRYLNDYLRVARLRDYGANGMHVIGLPEVRRGALWVSATLECFRLAGARQADMLIVQHGLFWENMPRTVEAMMKARLKMLFEHDMTLLGYHLPLDAHAEIGNNVLWLKHLGLGVEGVALGQAHGQLIGAVGIAAQRLTLRDLVEQVQALAGWTANAYAYGPQTIRRLGVVTGGGQGYLLEAVALGCDTFLTGETGEPTQAIAREDGINFIADGKHNSQQIGVQALGDLLQTQFGGETFFCDVPNQV